MPGHINTLAYAYGKPECKGRIKLGFDDFYVEETLSFIPSGEGEHLLLKIRKKNLNTHDVVTILAKYFNKKTYDIGYAGLKDKNALTTQWFSVIFPLNQQPDLSNFNNDNLSIEEVTRNDRKLKRGAIKRNTFEIRIRNFEGDIEAFQARVNLLKQQGVPNYFAQQRFGTNDYNLTRARQLLAGEMKCKRSQRSILLSAARSYLFNQVLSKRINAACWDKILPGDVMLLNNSRSFFNVEQIDEVLLQRLKQGDIHPTAPLWGAGESISRDACLALENTSLQQEQGFMQGLAMQNLKQDRRATRVFATELKFTVNLDTIKLCFTLPSGSYATSVLRECVVLW